MNKINLYVFSQIIKSCTLVFFIFVSIAWLMQLSRLLSAMNNLQIDDPSIQQLLNKEVDEDGYTFDELMKILVPYEKKYSQYFPLGQRFASKPSHLFSANPYCSFLTLF